MNNEQLYFYWPTNVLLVSCIMRPLPKTIQDRFLWPDCVAFSTTHNKRNYDSKNIKNRLKSGSRSKTRFKQHDALQSFPSLWRRFCSILSNVANTCSTTCTFPVVTETGVSQNIGRPPCGNIYFVLYIVFYCVYCSMPGALSPHTLLKRALRRRNLH